MDRSKAKPSKFISWMEGSFVRDSSGEPMVVYRGEHGKHDGAEFHTRSGSISFGTLRAANVYAAEPNRLDLDPVARQPLVIPAYLRICTPLICDPDDPFIDVATLREALGLEQARRIALKFSSHIEDTGRWDEDFAPAFSSAKEMIEVASAEELDRLYFAVFPLLDDPVEVDLLRSAGFDGAIYGGSGQTALEPEYRIFSAAQALPAFEVGWPAGEVPFSEPSLDRSPRSKRSSVKQVRAALADLVGSRGVELAEGLGRLVVTTSRELSTAGHFQMSHGALGSYSDHPGFRQMLAEQRAAKRRAIEAIGDVEDCAIVAAKGGGHRWLMILRDASEQGKWRTQSFDARGFSGHMVYNTKEAAIEAAAASGFTTRDDSALDRIQDTPAFQRGLYATDLISRVNSGDLQYAQANALLAQYDAEMGALNSIAAVGAQAFISAGGETIYLLADRITQGREQAVFLHEIVHRYARKLLGLDAWQHSLGVLKAWEALPPGSLERQIHDAARSRAGFASGGDESLFDEELFAYAVEEAVSRGVKPSALAHPASAAQWFDSVVGVLRGSIFEIAGAAPTNEFDAQALVDLAYAFAQLENPDRAQLILAALSPEERHILASRLGALGAGSGLEVEAMDSRPQGESRPWVLRDVSDADGSFFVVMSAAGEELGRSVDPARAVEAARRARLPSGTKAREPARVQCAMFSLEAVSAVAAYAPEGTSSIPQAHHQCAEVVARYAASDAWMKAPNGLPTKLTQDQWIMVRTENFINWFGDWEHDPESASQVVHPETGEPMVVYHGSASAGFSVFDGEKRRDGHVPSMYFSADRSTAKSYAGTASDADITQDEDGYFEESSGVYAVFLNIRSPWQESFEGAHWDGSRTGQWAVVDENHDEVPDASGCRYFETEEQACALAATAAGLRVAPASDSFFSTNSAVKQAADFGCDGCIIFDVSDPGPFCGGWYDCTNVFAVFSPTQVKSATDNTGAFSPKSPDIRFSLAEVCPEYTRMRA